MKTLTVVGLTALSFALGCGTDGDESESQVPNRDGAEPFKRVDSAPLANSNFVPRSVGNARETFIVKLAGDPVATVQGNARAAGTAFRAADKSSVRARVAAEQAAVESGVQSLGGQVLARYRDAYNGLRVKINRSELKALRNLPGVVAVHRAQTFKPHNVNGVQRVGGPATWTPAAGFAGFKGEGVKVAIIDSGIDYTHADFGGPGTPEAFAAAFAAGALPADPALFGPDAPKVKGGIDLVGDAYNANDPESVPQPDGNPLDCGGHGTHVAGSTAGLGVLLDGTTYNGPYDATTYTANKFEVGPGVAPKADLYAVRVFGCDGSTNVVVDAIEWAVANDMDVINMSLGSPFGEADDPSAEASTNAVRAGVIVVASAGNEGPISYITGSPASSPATISVAAQDPTAGFPAADLTASGTPTINAINANDATLRGAGLEVKVLLAADGTVSLGCDPAEYQGTAGKLVVVKRGNCARVARAIFGEQAGAAAVLLVNNAPAIPPFEGTIRANPDNGEPFLVTIPFLGIGGTDEAAIRALDGRVININAAANLIPNPGFNTMAGFSSLGPRLGDGHLKPDVTAPGVSILSAGIGTGNLNANFSGTSMAAPHVAGVAALARQAHPTWTASQIKAAIVNTAAAEGVVEYNVRRAGAGVVSAPAVARTQAFAFADKEEVHWSLGVLERTNDLLRVKTIRIENRGTTSARFSLGAERAQGAPHEVTIFPRTVFAPAGGFAIAAVVVSVDIATAGNSDEFRDVGGLIVAKPIGNNNNGVSLAVPYSGVLRPAANVDTSVRQKLSVDRRTTTARVTNSHAQLAGTADFYAWGLESDRADVGFADIRAVGAQSFPFDDSRLVVFAVNTHQQWFSPSALEVDIPIDSNGDGTPDFVVFTIDFGLVTTGEFTGQIVSVVQNLATGQLVPQFEVPVPSNSSTISVPVVAADIGITPENPRLAYSAAAFDILGTDSDQTVGAAKFNAFTSAVSQGDFLVVNPRETHSVPLTLDAAEFATTPALGHMIVTVDNLSGADEAELIGVGR